MTYTRVAIVDSTWPELQFSTLDIAVLTVSETWFHPEEREIIYWRRITHSLERIEMMKE